jgi:hypothetical protein
MFTSTKSYKKQKSHKHEKKLENILRIGKVESHSDCKTMEDNWTVGGGGRISILPAPAGFCLNI